MALEVDSSLRLAYPTGLLDELNEAAFRTADQDSRLRAMIAAVNETNPLVFSREAFGSKPQFGFAATLADEPRLAKWLSMSNPEKLSWIEECGRPYTVLWICLSRVADVFTWHFNHWIPRGDTGYLEIDLTQQPSATWAKYAEATTASLLKFGFEPLDKERAAEKTSLVLWRDYDSIPEDDPRWNEDGFEPPLTPAPIAVCLFGD